MVDSSRKFKDVVRLAYMRNFTDNVLYRYIVMNGTEAHHVEFNRTVKNINESLWVNIQEVSLKCPERQIPFIHLVAADDYDNEHLRLVMTDRNFKDDSLPEDLIPFSSISHMLILRITNNYDIISICDSNKEISAKMIIDQKYFISSAIDILLDIAMFNSYSFLRELSIKEKKDFNLKKIEFFNKKKFECFYSFEEDKSRFPKYLSLAFAARTTIDTLDYDMYISIWDEFIKTYYPDKIHIEETVMSQLKNHLDYGTLPDKRKLANKINQRSNGAYIILRTNRKNRSKPIEQELCDFFKISSFHIGAIRIVSLNEFLTTPMFSKFVKNLEVSAFKVVVNHKTSKNK